MKNICIIGSSLLWSRTLVGDLLAVFADETLDVRFVDLIMENAQICCRWGNAANIAYGRHDTYTPFTDRKKALDGIDAVLITLSTGGLEAMACDIEIPEKYGIYATVGDTAGAAGWSRSIRNLPVFIDLARDFKAICPQAFIVNYSNPLSTLTAALAQLCDNPVVGLCHAYFETKDVIQRVFGLPDWKRLSVEIAGMNHFTWVTDFRIDGMKGYPLLNERIGNGSIRDILPNESTDEIGISSSHVLFAELFDAYGYFPYPADRHISEFLPFSLTGSDENGSDTLNYCQLRRTSIAQRAKIAQTKRQQMMDSIDHLSAEWGIIPPKSRETGADMIKGYLYNIPVMDAVNTLNRGQIQGLPLDACVETLGVVDGFGVRPLHVSAVPEPLLELMRPQAVVTKWILEATLSGNHTLLYQALYRDPQCAHLKPAQARSLADELFNANLRYLKSAWGK